MITKPMRWTLKKNGFEDTAIDAMSYEEASQLIGEFKSNPETERKDTISQPAKKYELTEGNKRSNALACSVSCLGESAPYDTIIKLAEDFLKWINNE